MTAPRFDNTIGWNHIIYFIGIIFAAAIFYGSSMANDDTLKRIAPEVEKQRIEIEVLKAELRNINEKLSDIKIILRKEK